MRTKLRRTYRTLLAVTLATAIVGMFYLTFSPHNLGAQVASPGIQLLELWYYQHVLETDDFLVLGRYELAADGAAGGNDWDDYSRADAFIDLDNATSTLIQRINAPRLGPALFGFYLTAAELSSSAISSVASTTIELYSSPTVFTPSDTSGEQIPSSDTGVGLVTTAEKITDRIVGLVRSIEIENPTTGIGNVYQFDLGELVQGTQITSDGAVFALDAFDPIIGVAPDAFVNSYEDLGEAFTTQFVSLLINNEAVGATVLEVADSSIFAVGMTITIRDTDSDGDCNDDGDTTDTIDATICREVVEITAIDTTADSLTIDTGLAGAYTTAALGAVRITGLIESISISTAGDKTRTSLEAFSGDLGLAPWAIPLILLGALVLGPALGLSAFTGSFTYGLAAMPIMLAVAVLAGWVPLNALIVVLVILILGVSLWIVRLLPA